MLLAELNDIAVHYSDEGPKDAPALVFSNSLGTDLRLWDKCLPYLPDGVRLVRYDKRGHGLTSCPTPPYGMGTLVRDIELLIDHLALREVVVIGCSVGGLIAQGLAVKRLDQVRGIVLSNTGAKIGTEQMWADRIAAIESGGIEALADATMERWFSKSFLQSPELAGWRNMLTRQPAAGYMGVAGAISRTDFYSTTASLTLPTLAVAGSEDGATPPDLVRETADLVKGSRFELIRGAGHLPMAEAPEAFGALVSKFLSDIGHV